MRLRRFLAGLVYPLIPVLGGYWAGVLACASQGSRVTSWALFAGAGISFLVMAGALCRR